MEIMVGMEDGDSMLVMGIEVGEPVSVTESKVNNFFGPARYRDYAAQAIHIMWTPEPEPLPTEISILIVGVALGHEAIFLVKRIGKDDLYTRITPADAPWLSLGTAGGLRKMLETGQPMLLKSATDKALFGNITTSYPDVDEDGRI